MVADMLMAVLVVMAEDLMLLVMQAVMVPLVMDIVIQVDQAAAQAHMVDMAQVELMVQKALRVLQVLEEMPS